MILTYGCEISKLCRSVYPCQQRRLNLFQRCGNIAGVETNVVPVQHVATLWRMPKNASNRVNSRSANGQELLSKSCPNAVQVH